METDLKIILFVLILVMVFVSITFIIVTAQHQQNKLSNPEPRVIYHISDDRTLKMYDNGTTIIEFNERNTTK